MRSAEVTVRQGWPAPLLPPARKKEEGETI
jgi:hypothetical protein